MKFSCYKSDLTEALQFAIRAVAVKPMTPSISGIYLKAEGAALELQANNYSMGIITRIPVNIEVPGETLVDGKRFQEFIRKMPDDTITISNEDNSNALKMDSGGASVSLMTMNPEDFPNVKKPEAEKTFKVRTTMLRKLIQKTIFAVAKDDSRPVFTGGYFNIYGNEISLVATNTHRLALITERLFDSYDECHFVVPAEALRGIMLRIDPNEFDNYVTIGYSSRSVSFSFDNVYMTSRIIEGIYPSYEKVIPEESSTHVVINRDEFRNAIDFVALMSKETEYNTVNFIFRENHVEIFSTMPDIGGAARNIEAQVNGEDIHIAFNVDYVEDVLRVIDHDRVHIEFTNRYSPAKFSDPENPDYVYIATPVRT